MSVPFINRYNGVLSLCKPSCKASVTPLVNVSLLPSMSIRRSLPSVRKGPDNGFNHSKSGLVGYYHIVDG